MEIVSLINHKNKSGSQVDYYMDFLMINDGIYATELAKSWDCFYCSALSRLARYKDAELIVVQSRSSTHRRIQKITITEKGRELQRLLRMVRNL